MLVNVSPSRPNSPHIRAPPQPRSDHCVTAQNLSPSRRRLTHTWIATLEHLKLSWDDDLLPESADAAERTQLDGCGGEGLPGPGVAQHREFLGSFLPVQGLEVLSKTRVAD